MPPVTARVISPATAASRRDAATAVTNGRALLAARPSVVVESAYAWALHSAGRDAEALEHADNGLRLGTRDARAYHHRGMIRLALADRVGARRDLSEAVTINPYFSLTYGPQARATLAELDAAP